MFARFLEMNVKSDQKPELIKKMREEILPILKTYKTFLDVIPLDVEGEPAKFYVLSLWHDKTEMERYTKEQFPRVKALVDPFLTTPITIKNCMVDETVPRKFRTAIAA